MAEQETGPPVEVISGPSPTSALPGLSPEDLLKAERAKAEIQALQVRQVADLIPVLKQMVDSELEKVNDVKEEMQKVLSQMLVLHELLMKDAETQFEITKVFQSTLIILDQVNNQGTLSGTTEKPKQQKPDS